MNFIRDRKKFIREDIPENIQAMHMYIHDQHFIETEELKNRIYEALNRLPEACKNIFIASRFEGKKYKEIADEFQISIKTVESQMSKALKILRENLVDYLVGITTLFYLFLKLSG